MELKYELKPSLIRTNARFRGPTELPKYTNMINETVHDLKLLGKVLDQDEFIFTEERGQTNFIRDNFAAYYTGETPLITSNIYTSAEMYAQKDPLVTNINLLGSDWIVHGGCMKGGTPTLSTLQTDGTQDPCGVSKVVDVQEGYMIYVRMMAHKVSGTTNWFTLGSDNVNQGIGNLGKYPLPNNGSSVYVGHVFQCQHKESINIIIDIARGSDAGSAGIVQLSDISITLLEKSHVLIQPLNTSMKAQVNILDEKIRNIINNL